uniref:PH domain-containing protein n=1 Tax=Globisporangium ultimum (strain ATCC 200006 / CBS 805.95 / DAOM BR144) TaxID=431595 RepID=K3WH78_GLOUD
MAFQPTHARAATPQGYAVELEDGEEVHSIRSVDLRDLTDTDDYRPPRQHQHQRQHYQQQHHLTGEVYGSSGTTASTFVRSSSDSGDDMDTVSLGSNARSARTEPMRSFPSSPNLQPSTVLALSNRINTSPGAPLRRPNSSIQLTQPISYERRRGASNGGVVSRQNRSNSEERTGFARIYYDSQNFTSSTVFKLVGTTTVLEVRKSMANKIKIPVTDFSFYVIVVMFPGDSGSLSARTLHDDELILPLVEKLNRMRSNTHESEESLGSLRAKPKHRVHPPVKFVLKDVRGAPLDLEQEVAVKKAPVEAPALSFPVLVGKGVHSGYLQKASLKDPNVWRKRWFIIKGDQLLYCKSSTNQRDVTGVSLLNAYLARARPELRAPNAFELRTPRRVYQLCANSKDDYVGWVHALHVQISISTDNHRLYEAEIMITEDAVTRSESDSSSSRFSEPSLLQQVVSREDTLKVFRDFVFNTESQALLDTWIECELFRRSCIARENALQTNSGRSFRRSAKDEWQHLKVILEAVQALPMIESEELLSLRQSFYQTEQISRRLSLAMHSSSSDATLEYPRVELIAAIHQKIFKAIETGPFQQFIMQNGYRQVLERIVGRIS